MKKLRVSLKQGCLGFVFYFLGCTGASYDSTHTRANELLIQSTLDEVNISLSRGDCAAAYLAVYPLYNSINTTNAIRAAMAGTYGCYAKIKVMSVLSHLISFSNGLSGSGFFEFLVQEFPSTTTPADDKIPQSAQNGLDVVMSMLNPGAITIPAYLINSTSNNPGSLIYTDRVNDANAYTMFLSMAVLGSLGYRNGAPTSDLHQTVALPWSTATTTRGDGCAYAAALLSFKDSISFLASISTGSVSNAYNVMQSFLGTAVDLACQAGCTLCGGAVTCTTCPLTLRDRTTCTGLATDTNSCAAAGIVLFVNQSWTGP